jgi:hypothetical protein
MPSYEKDDILIPIEQIMRLDSGTLESIIENILLNPDECKCTIVDYPSIVSARYGNDIIDIVAGQGSIVCSRRCKIDSSTKLASTSWVYGRLVTGSIKCATVREKGRQLLESISETLVNKLKIVELDMYELIETISRSKIRGFVPICHDIDPLQFVELGRLCGTISTPNPLNPLSVFGKLGVEACVDNVVKIVGPLSRRLYPLLSISGEHLVTLYSGMGEILLIHMCPPLKLNDFIRKALILGILYMCSGEGE